MVKETPEEKLLRIIESSQPELRPLESSRPLSQNKNFNKEGNPAAFLTTKKFWVIAAGVGLGVALLLALSISRPASVQAPVPKIKEAVLSADLEKIKPAPEAVVSEAIPSPVPVVSEPAAEIKSPSPVVPIETITKNFRVVGIIWSEAPQVMIEDISDHRTYLLNQGNVLQGATVKEILKDRVVLSYDNQEIELR